MSSSITCYCSHTAKGSNGPVNVKGLGVDGRPGVTFDGQNISCHACCGKVTLDDVSPSEFAAAAFADPAVAPSKKRILAAWLRCFNESLTTATTTSTATTSTNAALDIPPVEPSSPSFPKDLSSLEEVVHHESVTTAMAALQAIVDESITDRTVIDSTIRIKVLPAVYRILSSAWKKPTFQPLTITAKQEIHSLMTSEKYKGSKSGLVRDPLIRTHFKALARAFHPSLERPLAKSLGALHAQGGKVLEAMISDTATTDFKQYQAVLVSKVAVGLQRLSDRGFVPKGSSNSSNSSNSNNKGNIANSTSMRGFSIATAYGSVPPATMGGAMNSSFSPLELIIRTTAELAESASLPTLVPLPPGAYSPYAISATPTAGAITAAPAASAFGAGGGGWNAPASLGYTSSYNSDDGYGQSYNASPYASPTAASPITGAAKNYDAPSDFDEDDYDDDGDDALSSHDAHDWSAKKVVGAGGGAGASGEYEAADAVDQEDEEVEDDEEEEEEGLSIPKSSTSTSAAAIPKKVNAFGMPPTTSEAKTTAAATSTTNKKTKKKTGKYSGIAIAKAIMAGRPDLLAIGRAFDLLSLCVEMVNSQVRGTRSVPPAASLLLADLVFLGGPTTLYDSLSGIYFNPITNSGYANVYKYVSLSYKSSLSTALTASRPSGLSHYPNVTSASDAVVVVGSMRGAIVRTDDQPAPASGGFGGYAGVQSYGVNAGAMGIGTLYLPSSLTSGTSGTAKGFNAVDPNLLKSVSKLVFKPNTNPPVPYFASSYLASSMSGSSSKAALAATWGCFLPHMRDALVATTAAAQDDPLSNTDSVFFGCLLLIAREGALMKNVVPLLATSVEHLSSSTSTSASSGNTSGSNVTIADIERFTQLLRISVAFLFGGSFDATTCTSLGSVIRAIETGIGGAGSKQATAAASAAIAAPSFGGYSSTSSPSIPLVSNTVAVAKEEEVSASIQGSDRKLLSALRSAVNVLCGSASNSSSANATTSTEVSAASIAAMYDSERLLTLMHFALTPLPAPATKPLSAAEIMAETRRKEAVAAAANAKKPLKALKGKKLVGGGKAATAAAAAAAAAAQAAADAAEAAAEAAAIVEAEQQAAADAKKLKADAEGTNGNDEDVDDDDENAPGFSDPISVLIDIVESALEGIACRRVLPALEDHARNCKSADVYVLQRAWEQIEALSKGNSSSTGAVIVKQVKVKRPASSLSTSTTTTTTSSTSSSDVSSLVPSISRLRGVCVDTDHVRAMFGEKSNTFFKIAEAVGASAFDLLTTTLKKLQATAKEGGEEGITAAKEATSILAQAVPFLCHFTSKLFSSTFTVSTSIIVSDTTSNKALLDVTRMSSLLRLLATISESPVTLPALLTAPPPGMFASSSSSSATTTTSASLSGGKKKSSGGKKSSLTKAGSSAFGGAGAGDASGSLSASSSLNSYFSTSPPSSLTSEDSPPFTLVTALKKDDAGSVVIEEGCLMEVLASASEAATRYVKANAPLHGKKGNKSTTTSSSTKLKKVTSSFADLATTPEVGLASSYYSFHPGVQPMIGYMTITGISSASVTGKILSDPNGHQATNCLVCNKSFQNPRFALMHLLRKHLDRFASLPLEIQIAASMGEIEEAIPILVLDYVTASANAGGGSAGAVPAASAGWGAFGGATPYGATPVSSSSSAVAATKPKQTEEDDPVLEVADRVVKTNAFIAEQLQIWLADPSHLQGPPSKASVEGGATTATTSSSSSGNYSSANDGTSSAAALSITTTSNAAIGAGAGAIVTSSSDTSSAASTSAGSSEETQAAAAAALAALVAATGQTSASRFDPSVLVSPAEIMGTSDENCLLIKRQLGHSTIRESKAPGQGNLRKTYVEKLLTEAYGSIKNLKKDHEIALHGYGAAGVSEGSSVVEPRHVRQMTNELNNFRNDASVIQWGSSILVRRDSADMDFLRAVITGADNTPYCNGFFAYDIKVPPQYPAVSPQVLIITRGGGKVRFNPNLYSSGKVCLSLLGTWSGPGWDSKHSTVYQVLLSLQSIVMNKWPYENEPSYDNLSKTARGKLDTSMYNAEVRLGTLRFAMTHQIRSPPLGFERACKMHFYYKKNEIKDQAILWCEEAILLARYQMEGFRLASIDPAAILKRVKSHLDRIQERVANNSYVHSMCLSYRVFERDRSGTSKDGVYVPPLPPAPASYKAPSKAASSSAYAYPSVGLFGGAKNKKNSKPAAKKAATSSKKMFSFISDSDSEEDYDNDEEDENDEDYDAAANKLMQTALQYGGLALLESFKNVPISKSIKAASTTTTTTSSSGASKALLSNFTLDDLEEGGITVEQLYAITQYYAVYPDGMKKLRNMGKSATATLQATFLGLPAIIARKALFKCKSVEKATADILLALRGTSAVSTAGALEASTTTSSTTTTTTTTTTSSTVAAVAESSTLATATSSSTTTTSTSAADGVATTQSALPLAVPVAPTTTTTTGLTLKFNHTAPSKAALAGKATSFSSATTTSAFAGAGAGAGGAVKGAAVEYTGPKGISDLGELLSKLRQRAAISLAGGHASSILSSSSSSSKPTTVPVTPGEITSARDKLVYALAAVASSRAADPKSSSSANGDAPYMRHALTSLLDAVSAAEELSRIVGDDTETDDISEDALQGKRLLPTDWDILRGNRETCQPFWIAWATLRASEELFDTLDSIKPEDFAKKTEEDDDEDDEFGDDDDDGEEL